MPNDHYDSGFRSNPNGYAFCNFSTGNPSWGSFVDTFGEAEIEGEELEEPLNLILTGAFYFFYRWYLSNNGHCIGMASTSLQYFHQGGSNLFSQHPSSQLDPPPISTALMSRLDVAQGRVLSQELIIHYAEQGQEGVNRVEPSIREIESDLRDGSGESTARVLCFIPSGSIWDVFANEAIRQAFFASHCVVPTRIVYPDSNRSLNGAKLFIYDPNSPGNDDLYIDLFEQGGKIHFNYINLSGFQYSTQNGFTLGTATLQKHLIDDVNLPFSQGLKSFMIDLILSPARIRVEDHAGNILGFKEGQIHSDPNLGYVCPWLENYLLVRKDADVTSHRIIGEAEGTYMYITIHPNGKSLTIKNAKCTPNIEDILVTDSNLSKVRIQVGENKDLDLHIAETQDDGTVKYINLTYTIQQNESIELILSEKLDGVDVVTPDRVLDVHLEIKHFEGDRLIEERSIDAKIPADKYLSLPQGLWENITNFQVNIHK